MVNKPQMDATLSRLWDDFMTVCDQSKIRPADIPFIENYLALVHQRDIAVLEAETYGVTKQSYRGDLVTHPAVKVLHRATTAINKLLTTRLWHLLNQNLIS
jgi:hypothetical protein